MSRTQTNSRHDFSVSGYQHFSSGRPRDARLAEAVRALGDFAASAMGRLLNSMYENRRRQVMAAIQCSAQVIRLAGWCDERRSSKSCVQLGEAVHGMRIRCSVTGAPCEGDRAHLCDAWGCAWNGGLSPISHENFS
jgi:hypothetical protein